MINLKKVNIWEVILNIFITIIVISLYVFVTLYIYTNFRERKRKEVANKIIEKVDKQVVHNKEEIKKDDLNNKVKTEIKTSYQGEKFTVLGKINIRKINIYQPILKENTKEAYDVASVKMSGPNLNTNGNVAIGGHNFMKGKFFIKLEKLVNNDIITITDLLGNKVNYYVYEYGKKSPEDPSYLIQPNNGNEKIITLVTCTKGGKERYYVKAKAK